MNEWMKRDFLSFEWTHHLGWAKAQLSVSFFSYFSLFISVPEIVANSSLATHSIIFWEVGMLEWETEARKKETFTVILWHVSAKCSVNIGSIFSKKFLYIEFINVIMMYLGFTNVNGPTENLRRT